MYRGLGHVSQSRLDADHGARKQGFDPDEGRRKEHLDSRHGEGTYDLIVSLKEKQNCLCGICGNTEPLRQDGRVKHLMVDHCAKTLKVRGLICSRCNMALGHFRDDPVLLRKAAAYLRSYQP